MHIPSAQYIAPERYTQRRSNGAQQANCQWADPTNEHVAEYMMICVCKTISSGRYAAVGTALIVFRSEFGVVYGVTYMLWCNIVVQTKIRWKLIAIQIAYIFVI